MDPLPDEFLDVYFRATCPAAGWPSRFTIITAYNPDGKIVPAAENEKADVLLAAELTARNWAHFRVTGGSRDGQHREPGWGILVPDTGEAMQLCQRFSQLAFFQVEKGEVVLVDARSGERRKTGYWSERLFS